MSLLDKNGASFDQLIRDQKGISALAMIMATYYIPKGTQVSERKAQIARRLIDAYKLFRPDKKVIDNLYNGAGTYGQIDKETKTVSTNLSDAAIKDAFDSQYTLGLELGIWKNSDLELCDLALKVAKMEITITEYLDVIFQNLFSYQERMGINGEYEFQYVHFLFEVLDNLDSNFEISKEKLKELIFPSDTGNDNRNALFNYLKDTSYFESTSNTLYLIPTWQAKLQELKMSCNLEYRDNDPDETQRFFKNKDNYANYVTKINLKSKFSENDEICDTPNHYEASGSSNSHNVIGKNIIYYGAPGTGKSYGINEEIKKVYLNFNDETDEGSRFVFRTTMHPEYTYNDFVGQVMPRVTNGIIKYEFIPGIFTRALAQAIKYKDKGKPVYLVLEELSRANVAAVFGDLFQLLDRKNGESEYSITNSLISQVIYPIDSDQSEIELGNKKIYIPSNLFILGTVNTNDQNVFVMDTAFKRRFEWKYISTKPKGDENNPQIPIINFDKSMNYVKWYDFYQELNKYITVDMALGEDKQVGQFFIKFSEDDKDNKLQIQNKLLQYLWDDVQGAVFNGTKLFNSSISSFSDLYDKFENDQIIFSEDFISKLSPYIKQSWSTQDDES